MKVVVVIILASAQLLFAQTVASVGGGVIQNRSELADFKVTVDLPDGLETIPAGQTSLNLGSWPFFTQQPFSSCSMKFSSRNYSRRFKKAEFSVAEALYFPPESSQSTESLKASLVELKVNPLYLAKLESREALMDAILSLGGKVETPPKIHVLFSPVTANSTFQLACETRAHYESFGDFVEALNASEVGKFIQIEAKF